jgi:hypothetical protein
MRPGALSSCQYYGVTVPFLYGGKYDLTNAFASPLTSVGWSLSFIVTVLDAGVASRPPFLYAWRKATE